MSISVYLAIKDEIVKYPKNLLAQIGFGFQPDGTVRIPKLLRKSTVVIDDIHLPNISNSAIQILKSKFERCILDFERRESVIHKKLIQGMQDKTIIALPERFHAYAPKALPIISCMEPCNSWQNFLNKNQKKYPNGWMLEITPWNHKKEGTANKNEGYLQNSLCYFQRDHDKVLYYDTKDTISEKITLAEQYGCKAAIALYQEVKQLK